MHHLRANNSQDVCCLSQQIEYIYEYLFSTNREIMSTYNYLFGKILMCFISFTKVMLCLIRNYHLSLALTSGI